MRFRKGDTVVTGEGNRALIIEANPVRGYYVRFLQTGMHGWRPAGKLQPSGLRTKFLCFLRGLRRRPVVHA